MAMKRYATVDAYINSLDCWQDEVVALRKIILSTELVENVKWGSPCYTHNGKNVVGIAAFRDYFGLWFHQGVFMADEAGVLLNCQEGKTRGQRQWRFKSGKELKATLVKRYLKEAIELVDQGKEIKPQRGKPVVIPPELAKRLEKNRTVAKAFEELTLGKKREYTEYIAEAKRDETRAKRIDKILPMIKQGLGLNDKYRS